MAAKREKDFTPQEPNPLDNVKLQISEGPDDDVDANLFSSLSFRKEDKT